MINEIIAWLMANEKIIIGLVFFIGVQLILLFNFIIKKICGLIKRAFKFLKKLFKGKKLDEVASVNISNTPFLESPITPFEEVEFDLTGEQNKGMSDTAVHIEKYTDLEEDIPGKDNNDLEKKEFEDKLKKIGEEDENNK